MRPDPACVPGAPRVPRPRLAPEDGAGALSGKLREVATKRHTAGEIVSKLETVETLRTEGVGLPEAVRRIGISVVTYRRWRRDFGGMNAAQVDRMKRLERENSVLRRELAKLEIENLRIRAQVQRPL